jgi:hypothetical protein
MQNNQSPEQDFFSDAACPSSSLFNAGLAKHGHE